MASTIEEMLKKFNFAEVKEQADGCGKFERLRQAWEKNFKVANLTNAAMGSLDKRAVELDELAKENEFTTSRLYTEKVIPVVELMKLFLVIIENAKNGSNEFSGDAHMGSLKKLSKKYRILNIRSDIDVLSRFIKNKASVQTMDNQFKKTMDKLYKKVLTELNKEYKKRVRNAVDELRLKGFVRKIVSSRKLPKTSEFSNPELLQTFGYINALLIDCYGENSLVAGKLKSMAG